MLGKQAVLQCTLEKYISQKEYPCVFSANGMALH
jgi:hypothetical protein